MKLELACALEVALFVLRGQVDPELARFVSDEGQVLPLELLFEVVVVVVLGEADWAMCEIRVFEEGFQVDHGLADQIIRLEQVQVVRLDSQLIVLAWVSEGE